MLKGLIAIGSVVLLGVSAVFAQAECPTVENIQEIAALCEDVAAGELCAGSDGITVDDSTVIMGETVSLEGVTQIAMNSEVAVFSLNGGGESNVRAILYGTAILENRVSALANDFVVLTAQNTAGYDVNLREGGGTTFAEVGTLSADAQVQVDGRSSDSQWLRVQSESGIAWVKASLLTVEGDASSLSITDSPYTEEFQSVLLTMLATEGCSLVTGGLLLQQSGDTTARFNINDVDIAFGSATVLVQVVGERLNVQVLDGEAIITVGTTEQTVGAGEAASVALDSKTRLAVDSPDTQADYTFANIANAPLALLPEVDANLCVTGVPFDLETRETRGGPGQDYSELAPLDNQSHYDVEGFATAGDGQIWMKLANGRWTPSLENDLVGACSNYVEVEAPPINQAMSVPQNQSFVPVANTRFQAYSGNDVLTGQCSTAPIAVCDHLAVVIPNTDGTIGWRGQEPLTYVLSPQGGNRFMFSGRNFQNNANLSLDLTFNSASAWIMTMTTVFDSDPTCTHTFYYTATKI